MGKLSLPMILSPSSRKAAWQNRGSLIERAASRLPLYGADSHQCPGHLGRQWLGSSLSLSWRLGEPPHPGELVSRPPHPHTATVQGPGEIDAERLLQPLRVDLDEHATPTQQEIA